MPVLAAARNPPVNATAGTPYNQEYSGGSVGPIDAPTSGHNSVVNHTKRTFEHVQHTLGDDKSSSHIDTC
jgi:hypothetical protein